MNWIDSRTSPVLDMKYLCYKAKTASQYFVAEWREGAWWTEDGLVDPTHYMALQPPTK